MKHADGPTTILTDRYSRMVLSSSLLWIRSTIRSLIMLLIGRLQQKNVSLDGYQPIWIWRMHSQSVWELRQESSYSASGHSDGLSSLHNLKPRGRNESRRTTYTKVDVRRTDRRHEGRLTSLNPIIFTSSNVSLLSSFLLFALLVLTVDRWCSVGGFYN